MGNFAENLNLGNRFRPPLSFFFSWIAPSRKGHDVIAAKDCWFNIGGACLSHKYFQGGPETIA